MQESKTNPPCAEIISIGTELLIGHTVNTDASYVARELASLGIDVFRMHTVGDNPARLEETLRAALGRSDLVITTGGLGPTDDDLSKEVVARVAGHALTLFPEALEKLLSFQKKLHGDSPLPENQRRQAMFPEGSTLLKNALGTAPGCMVEGASGQLICMLPGPPRELLPMLEKELMPQLAARFQRQPIFSYKVRVFGRGESEVAAALEDILKESEPTAATYVGAGELYVRVTTRAKDKASASAVCAPVIDTICRRLGDVVYGVDVDSLEALVVEELAKRKMTVATAESCTGGLVAKRLTDRPGSSEVFGLGLVTYSNTAKMKMLGVRPETLSAHGAVSSDTATEMAEGVRRVAEADFGLAITGIAGPSGGSLEKPVGLVYVALATSSRTYVRELLPNPVFSERSRIRLRSANHALDMLRRELAHLPVEVELTF